MLSLPGSQMTANAATHKVVLIGIQTVGICRSRWNQRCKRLAVAASNGNCSARIAQGRSTQIGATS